jgi:hypothetical protein
MYMQAAASDASLERWVSNREKNLNFFFEATLNNFTFFFSFLVCGVFVEEGKPPSFKGNTVHLGKRLRSRNSFESRWFLGGAAGEGRKNGNASMMKVALLMFFGTGKN